MGGGRRALKDPAHLVMPALSQVERPLSPLTTAHPASRAATTRSASNAPRSRSSWLLLETSRRGYSPKADSSNKAAAPATLPGTKGRDSSRQAASTCALGETPLACPIYTARSPAWARSLHISPRGLAPYPCCSTPVRPSTSPVPCGVPVSRYFLGLGSPPAPSAAGCPPVSDRALASSISPRPPGPFPRVSRSSARGL